MICGEGHLTIKTFCPIVQNKASSGAKGQNVLAVGGGRFFKKISLPSRLINHFSEYEEYKVCIFFDFMWGVMWLS